VTQPAYVPLALLYMEHWTLQNDAVLV